MPPSLRSKTRDILPRLAIRLGCLFVFVAVAWANFTELPEIAYATGRLEPSSALRRIEHPEGGLVGAFHAAEGDNLRAGDVIVTLSEQDIEAELQTLRARKTALQRSVARAITSLDVIGADALTPVDTNIDDTFVRARVEAYEIRRARLADQVLVRREAILAARSLLASFVQQKALAQTEADRLQNLRSKGLVTDAQVFAAQSQLFNIVNSAISAQDTLATAIAEEADAVDALFEFHVQARESLYEDLTAAEDNLQIAEETIREAQLRRERLTIRMPIDGIIQTMHLRTVGEVVDEGGLIAEVLPANEELIAVVLLKPLDAGHVSVGDPVELRLTTFEVKKFGTIKAWVDQISPTSIEDERGVFSYRLRLRLDRQDIGAGEALRALRAGIEVHAAIVTGNRSVLDYALAPIAQPLAIAFNER